MRLLTRKMCVLCAEYFQIFMQHVECCEHAVILYTETNYIKSLTFYEKCVYNKWLAYWLSFDDQQEPYV